MTWDWIVVLGFLSSVGVLLGCDLLAHRKHDAISFANALAWTIIYIAAAVAFAGLLYVRLGPEDASLFLAGFVMEKALSMDNLMVFVAIFSYFHIPSAYQHRVLYWGIFGAIFFRLVFVTIGAGALEAFGPAVGLAFGAIVLWSAWKMIGIGAGEAETPVDYENEWYVRVLKRWIPITAATPNEGFLVRKPLYRHGTGPYGPYSQIVDRRKFATPLLVCLVTVEISDVLFSFDSVPAVIAITQKPLLVYTAMIFAILGLRSLYFVISAAMRYLEHIGTAIIAVLFFIGAKMIVQALNGLFDWHIWEPSPILSLGFVLGALLAGGVVSLILVKRRGEVER